MTTEAPPSARTTARLAGGLYLALLPLGAFSFAYVPSVLVVRGDAEATCRNIAASAGLFRAGTMSHLASQVLVVFVLLALYRLLRPVNPGRAALMAVLGLLCVPVSFVSEVFQLAALRVLTGADDGAFTASQLHAQATLFLDMGRNGVLVAQIFWGLWMLPMSVLVFRSGFLPKLLAIPVAIAGTGYVVDSCLQLLLPGIVAIGRFTFVAELLLPVWLLVRGVDVERWRQSA